MLALALAVAPAATAKTDQDKDRRTAFVSAGLLAQAEAQPDALFEVIVEGTRGVGSAGVARALAGELGQAKRSFRSIAGASATISGKQLLKLARHPHVFAITPDSPVASSDYQDSEMWRASTGVDQLWGSSDAAAPQAPAIAVVDSGVDGSKVEDFGGRLVADLTICSVCPEGASGDEQGHGTMVAALAAGSALDHVGGAPNAPIVSLRTSDEDGMSNVSDVIAAIDWIIENKDAYNVRVANFSLTRADATSFRVDPLNHAVERLWFAGVVVVAAAGNHGSADGPVVMKAPASDPFVIGVGALDPLATVDPLDDTVPYWSAYGYTVDGFQKPDLAAPGRYLISAVPAGSTLPAALPERVVAPGYMWMSGTSFAAPVVSGIAAQLLARHPEWTPDQVKGALMVSAGALADGTKAGVGTVDGDAAAAVESPPNPNENLYSFVVTDSATGAKVFDGEAWAGHVANDAAWSSAAWGSAAWSSAAWGSAAWGSAAWSSAAWAESTTNEAAWNEAAWGSAAWGSAAWYE